MKKFIKLARIMKQYTTPEQTAKLIELGLEKPRSVSHCKMDLDMQIIPYRDYSIGELIEMLPTSAKIKGYDNFLYIDPMRHGGGWDVGYMRCNVELASRTTELIDALYDMVVKLKEEGVI